MEDEAIKKLIREGLKTPENKNFNDRIIQQLQVNPKKKRQIPFDEKTILNWFLIIAGFVLFFYLQQGTKLDANAILIGSIVSAIPLYLLLFNKIYSLKNQYR